MIHATPLRASIASETAVISKRSGNFQREPSLFGSSAMRTAHGAHTAAAQSAKRSAWSALLLLALLRASVGLRNVLAKARALIEA